MNIGLLPLPRDKKDFKYAEVFGLPSLTELPDFYMTAEPRVKNQKNSLMCHSFAGAAVAEDEDGVELSPEYLASRVYMLNGTGDVGSDLRAVCKALKKLGTVAKQDAPYSLETKDHDWLADYRNWPELWDKAVMYTKQAYFAVTGPFDIFDNMRLTMWDNRAEKRSILTGTIWYSNYNTNSIIPFKPYNEIGAHALKVCGWKKINGILYLIAQNSWGKTIGDGGLFYFPREVVNRDFKYGAFTFKDADPDFIKKLQAERQSTLQYIILLITLLIANTKRKIGWFLGEIFR